MGKVIYRLPSKGTQYGYAEFEFDYDGNPYDLGREYRAFVNEFVRGEADEQRMEKETKTFKRNSDTVGRGDEVYDLPPTQEEAVRMVTEGLGATVYDEPVEEDAPEWEAPPPAPSDDDWDF